MIEIGKQKSRAVRERFYTAQRPGGFLRPKLNPDGSPVIQMSSREVWARTKDVLNGHFCKDRGRKLIVGLVNGDLLKIRPQGTRRTVSVSLFDVYSWILRQEAGKAQLERARKRKEAKNRQRQNRKLAYRERNRKRMLIADLVC